MFECFTVLYNLITIYSSLKAHLKPGINLKEYNDNSYKFQNHSQKPLTPIKQNQKSDIKCL